MWRILLSPLIIVTALILIPSVEKALFFLPLLFSMAVSLVNLDKFKINRYLGIILSVMQSYLVFIGLAIVIHFFDEWLVDTTSGEITEYEGIIIITSGGYLAALLLFYFNSYLYQIKGLRFSYLTITLGYLFIVLVMSIFSVYEKLQLGIEKFPSFLISWCIFMSLSYSISLNRASIKPFFKTN